MILEYADPKYTISELKKAIFWTQVRTVLWVLVVSSVVGIISYYEGYRRGCENTINIIEQKLEGLVKRLMGGGS